MMDEPVDQGTGQGVIVEDFSPVLKRSVGRQNNRSLLVAFGDDLEEEIGPLLIEGEEADLVDHQELGGRIRLELFLQRVIGERGVEAVDEIRRRDEEGLGPFLTGGIGDGEGQMGLADAGRSQESALIFFSS